MYIRSSEKGLHQFCVFGLSLADIVSSVFFGLGTMPIVDDDFCLSQAVMIQQSLGVPLWTGVLIFNLLRQTVFHFEDSGDWQPR